MKGAPPMAPDLTLDRLRELGRKAGFDLVGATTAEAMDEEFDRYRRWIERGFHGGMAYLERGAEIRRDPRSLLEGARSVIVCASSYLAPQNPNDDARPRPAISRYALGRDYHKVLRRRLKRLVRLVEEALGRAVRAHLCVDSAPLLERALAARAGLGWIGKNTCLVNPDLGSFLFLGEIIADIEIEAASPVPDRCGRCRRCIEACPTGALVEPYVLDARRCISYLTIEHRGPIEPALAREMGLWVFGCDICQEVCPWNERAAKRAPPSAGDFRADPKLLDSGFEDLVFENASEFDRFFAGKAIRRARWEGWNRNLLAAVENALGAVAPAERPRLEKIARRLRHLPH